MRLNTSTKHAPTYTHEGAKASHLTPIAALRRSVLACLLWEDSFYEDGQSIAARISALSRQVPPEKLASLAIEARQQFHLRHVPLLLLLELAQTAKGIPGLTRNAVEAVISRPDEMGELIKIYWKDGKKPIPHGILKGIRAAALNFDAFQLAKWNRDAEISLRDVIFLAHIAYPDHERSSLVANMVNKSYYPEATKGGFQVGRNLNLSGNPVLEAPATWEAELASIGGDKGKRSEMWERKLNQMLNRESGGLGYMALLRNLRNMVNDGANTALVAKAIQARIGARRVLPYRFVQASKVAPQFFDALDFALKASVADQEPFSGTTVVIVDVSGSMNGTVSGHSEITRREAAVAIAGCVPGNTRLIAFGTSAMEVPALKGLGVKEVMDNAGMKVGWSTNAHIAVALANSMKPLPDRLILITDEQVTQSLPKPLMDKAYVINVAAYQNGVGYGHYTHIDGFSAATLDYIREIERGA